MVYFHQHSLQNLLHSELKENNFQIKMLNNRGPKMDPWGTPKRITYKLFQLYAVFIFVLCFLLDK